MAFFAGVDFGLRRFDQVLFAVETSDGTELSPDAMGTALQNSLDAAEGARRGSGQAILLIAADPPQWADLTRTPQTIGVVALARVRKWDSGQAATDIRSAIHDTVDITVLDPFTFAGPCPDNMFFGREREVRQILLSPKQSFAVVGPRRIGKTSLLRQLRLGLAPYAGQQYVYLDCATIRDFSELAMTLLRAISPKQYVKIRYNNDIESNLIAAASRLGARYLVCLDEFDAIAEAPPSSFGRIKPWFTGRFQGRMRFVVAGYRALWDVLENRESYLFNVFTPITLGPFEQSEGEFFVRQTLGELRIPVVDSPDAVTAILDYTGLQPWLLQVFCSHIVERYALLGREEPTLLVNRVAESVEIRQLVFNATARNCSPLGNAILACVASDIAHDELSLIDAFRSMGIHIPVETMIKEVGLLQMVGAINRSPGNIQLTSKLLRLHLNAFWSFERSVEALRHGEQLYRQVDNIGAALRAADPRVKLLGPSPSSIIELFYSYSHKDEHIRDQLENHLRLLNRQEVIAGWHDRRIAPGTEWEGEISNHVNSARIILLLISADFLASDYCYDVEMTRALERHASGAARVIPVIVRACDWTHARFGKLQALPKNGEPIMSWTNVDEALTDVAKGIRAVANELRENNL